MGTELHSVICRGTIAGIQNALHFRKALRSIYEEKGKFQEYFYRTHYLMTTIWSAHDLLDYCLLFPEGMRACYFYTVRLYDG